MFSQPVKLDFTSSGYYCVNIMDNEKKNIQSDDCVLVAVEDVTLTEQKNADVQSQCDEEILTISDKMLSRKTQNPDEASQTIWSCFC